MLILPHLQIRPHTHVHRYGVGPGDLPDWAMQNPASADPLTNHVRTEEDLYEVALDLGKSVRGRLQGKGERPLSIC